MARQLARTRTVPVDPEQPDEGEITEPAEGAESASNDGVEETHTSTRRPASRRSASRTEPSRGHSVRRGWEGAKANKAKRQIGDEFKVKENTDYLLKFLEPEPFATYLEHFIKSLASNGERASFVCLEEDCPLDAIGDKPGDRALFNVAIIDDRGHATPMWWKATSSILDLIEDYAFSERNSPIDRTDLYFEVSKKKAKNGIFQYRIEPIKARDLADEGTEPLTDDELGELRGRLFDADTALKVPSHRDLREIAEGLED